MTPRGPVPRRRHPRPTRRGAPTATPFGIATLCAATVGLIGVAGPNLAAALLSAAVLVLGIILLWRPGEPPVLLFLFALPWLQASVSIFHATWLGKDLALYAPIGGETHTAVTLSLLGVATMAIGMRWGAGRLCSGPARIADGLARVQPLPRWLWLYVTVSIVGLAARAATEAAPGFHQVALAVANLKWAFFFMLAYSAFVRHEAASPLLILPFLFELGLGLGNFFSDFKTVFLITLLAVGTAGVRFSVRTLIALLVPSAALIALLVVWTAIKGDYRAFVSGDGRAQVVKVDYVTGIEKLFSLALDLDREALGDGLDRLVRRLSYVEFFGVTIDYVPRVVPHQGGAVLADAIARPFMPRLLFPEKSVINDTIRTNEFTGGLAGDSAATSISLGYVAECYIDFGEGWMFAALLAIGLLYGRIHRSLMTSSCLMGPLGMGLSAAVLLTVGSLENSFTKVFGGVVVALLAGWLFRLLLVPWVCPWLCPADRRLSRTPARISRRQS